MDTIPWRKEVHVPILVERERNKKKKEIKKKEREKERNKKKKVSLMKKNQINNKKTTDK